MHFEGAFRHLAGKGDDLANDQLRDGATVGEGAVEDADPVGSSVARSTWFVPMQKQPTAMRFFAWDRTREVSLVLLRIPRT